MPIERIEPTFSLPRIQRYADFDVWQVGSKKSEMLINGYFVALGMKMNEQKRVSPEIANLVKEVIFKIGTERLEEAFVSWEPETVLWFKRALAYNDIALPRLNQRKSTPEAD